MAFPRFFVHLTAIVALLAGSAAGIVYAKNPSCLSAVLEAEKAKQVRPIEELVQQNIRQEHPDIFYQLELEGLAQPYDPRDSSGNFFSYYRPKGEMRADLVDKLVARMSKVERAIYKTKRLVQKDPWNAFNRKQKFRYVQDLEKAVIAEKGEAAAWGGTAQKTFLLMERDASVAPRYVAEHPSFERWAYLEQEWRKADEGYFSLPEITTAKERPARTIAEVIERNKVITKDTGHASPHYPLFMKIKPEHFKAKAQEIEAILIPLNEELVLEALAGSSRNLKSDSIFAWHAGKSARMKELIEKMPSEPRLDPDDFNSQKYSAVALRYWGIENGDVYLSFELRSSNNPFKGEKKLAVGLDEVGEMPKRDYSRTERNLTALKIFAEGVLSKDPLPESVLPRSQPLKMTKEVADAVVAKAIVDRNYNPAQFAGLEEILKFIEQNASNRGTYHHVGGDIFPNVLYPFAEIARNPSAPEAKAFLDEFLQLSSEVRALEKLPPRERAERAGHFAYRFDTNTQAWALAKLAEKQGQIEALAGRIDQYLRTHQAPEAPAAR